MANRRIKDFGIASIPLLVLFALWWMASAWHWLPAWALPSPYATWLVFKSLIADGTLLKLVGASALNAVPPYLAAVLIATILGIVIGSHPTASKLFLPFISILYPIPSLAFLPLIILTTGFTRTSVWILIFISCFLKIIYNVISGVRHLNPTWILAAKNFGLNKLDIMLKVIIPGSVPHIITGLRMGFGSSWRSLIGAEMLVTGVGGLGKFLWMSQWSFSYEKVIISIFAIATIGLGMELLVFKKIEKSTLKAWGL